MVRLVAAQARVDTAAVGCIFRAIEPGCPPGGKAVLRGPGGRCAVTTYIMLINWTDQGIRDVKSSPKRLDAARKLLGDMGGTLRTVYMTMGEFDMVFIAEAPDDAVAARFAVMLGKAGNIRTRTIKAFPELAYREIITSMG